MILNIKLSKAFPKRAIDYATEKNILDNTIKRNLFSDKNHIAEMKETADKFGKWHTREERKSFSMIISPNPKDSPTEEQVLEISQAILDRFFSSIQGFLVLHKDKGRDSKKTKPVLHSHFYGSIIDPVTGKNIHLSNRDVKEIREWADSYAHEHFGWTMFKQEKRGRNGYRDRMMQKVLESGHSSWMAELTKAVEGAYISALSFSDFERRLRNQGIWLDYTDKSEAPRFRLAVGAKEISVKATTISNLLTWEALSKKYTELAKEEKFEPQRFKQRHTEEVKMGSENHQRRSPSTTGSGTPSGTEPAGRYRGKINYSCIFCTHDKSICARCTRDKEERGGYTYGGRTR